MTGPASGGAQLVLDDIEADLVSRLGAHRNAGGREQSIAIVFMDLTGFTTLSEKALAYDVVHLLNSYYREVGDAILHNRGWIDKYVGDGIMALFGLRGGKPEDFCMAAARAALEGIARVKMLSPVAKSSLESSCFSASASTLASPWSAKWGTRCTCSRLPSATPSTSRRDWNRRRRMSAPICSYRTISWNNVTVNCWLGSADCSNSRAGASRPGSWR